MNQRNPIVKATFIVFATIWIAMNLYTLITDPVFFWGNIPNMVHGAFVTLVGCVMGVVITAGLILLERSLAQMRLQGGSFNGITSSIGPVPILAPPAKRSKAKECLPIESQRVKQWIEANKTTNPAHVTLFMAVWQTLSAHKTHPASHRKGGHGGRTLAQHCMAVADTALGLAPTWSYDGVYIKRPGKSPKLIIAKRDANYVFDPLDPIIPVLALAHDLGKIEAYKLQADGTVLTSETGTEQDDAGVEHDRLGSRILARISEFWELPPNDTRALSRVISHYHHPSNFPVDKDGLSIGDRVTALMEFLILADKTTGQRESGISAAIANEDTISETEAEEIYAALVACLTEQGRINGTGDRDTDRAFKIGQKHGNVVYMREEPLLAAMCRKLGVSVELGRGRLILLNRILHVLQEKSLLTTSHNGVDFNNYLPLYQVRFFHSETSAVLADWHQTIVIAPTAKHRELISLVDMPGLTTLAKIVSPYFGHLNQIPDPTKLLEMVENAFGQDVLLTVRKGITGASPHEIRSSRGAASDQEETLVVPNPATTAVIGDADIQKNRSDLPSVAHAPSQCLAPEPSTSSTGSPLLPAKSESVPLGTLSSPAPSKHAIDWEELDKEVKDGGFDATGDITVKPDDAPCASDIENFELPDVGSDGKDGGDLGLLEVEVACDIGMEDLDLVAGKGETGDSSSDVADSFASPELPAALDQASLSESPVSADQQGTGVSDALGIPKNHDLGKAVKDAPTEPVSKYKKQKQDERNTENLGKLQQAGDPSQFIQNLATAKSKKKAGDGLLVFLGAGNDPKPLQKTNGNGKGTNAESTTPEEADQFRQVLTYETFQKLIQRAVEGGTLHCLATLEGKHFILQSVIESAFPGTDIDQRLPASFVERRSTRAGTVLLIPVTALAND